MSDWYLVRYLMFGQELQSTMLAENIEHIKTILGDNVTILRYTKL